MKPRLRTAVGWGCVGWGLLVAGAGVGHSIASWQTALAKRGSLDGRFALLMAVGWVLLACGGALAYGGWRLRRGGGSPAVVAAVAAFLLGFFVLLSHAAGPVGIGGTLLLLAGLLWLARTRPAGA